MAPQRAAVCRRAAPALLMVVIVFSLASMSALTPSALNSRRPAAPATPAKLFKLSEVQYLSFEPWNGGWNNRRMSLELAFLLALKLNRTLVLPPVRSVAKLPGKSGYEDFFNLTVMREFVNVLTWNEFQQVLPHLRRSAGSSDDNAVCKFRMPNPRGFCEAAREVRRKARVVAWDFLKLVLPWPQTPTSTSAAAELAHHAPRRQDRLADLQELENESIIHFPQNLFGLFYHVFYYASADLRQRYWRAVRDGLQFRRSLRESADKLVAKLGGGEFSCLHVRRRDFKQQYSHQWLAPELIANNTRPHLSARLYLATDEADESFISRLMDGLQPVVQSLTRWKDVVQVLGTAEETPEHLYGVLEQLLCSKAAVFIGTKYSTFSAYTTRLRGYDRHTKNKQCYFTDTKYPDFRPMIAEEKPFSWGMRWRRAFWSREYPEAWEGLDEPLRVYRARFPVHPDG
eukprot:TRINITY_DN8921_c0_g1_i1.p1 TRINITY_DN8921_c0_g1~~TRINITY_DN8921_c0_g1_i1.p1  ORF type:complete len:457 (+),score=68.70 TRINITY_DN8921_c0_g1_i1:100-1470(+)